uniref:RNA-directed DNA polymerase n=1 Tax=Tanacetum cinerariifolium TaxID=118510 RepID=A0A6L2KNC9_TANCI|nr:retrotransposable element Tf2 [Tanacetum cinerariifolium]
MRTTAMEVTTSQLGRNQRQNMQFTRVTKIEVSKFEGDDVKGWMYKCEQFFKVDNVADEQKVPLISIHLFDIALMWHRQFMRLLGSDIVPWLVYRGAIMQRFGNSFDDPLGELKNCKYENIIEDYQNSFDKLLSRVDIREDQAISFYMVGLPTDIELAVRMFKPQTLSVAYSLSKLQIETNEATKKKNKAPLFPTPKFNSYTSGGNQISSPKPLALPAPNVNWRTKAATPQVGPMRKRLSQKEMEEKRAKNLCFYCDQRYVPCHKCTGQVYLLEVFLDEEESQEEEEIVFGMVGKTQIHILIDTSSTHNFIDTKVAKKVGCLVKNTCPLQVSVAGGKTLVSTNICPDFVWKLQGETFSASTMTLSLGVCDMVLGVQWLSTLGDIQFNFQHLKMVFDHKGKTLILSGTTKTVVQWMSGKQAAKTGNQASNLAVCVYPTAMLNMLSASVPTTENSGIPNTPSVLDPLIEEFADVFEVPNCLPPKRGHDHKIPLKEGTQPINMRPYRHPPTQKDAIESMVKDLLDSRDKFLIPLIEELIDELHGSMVFSKLDLRSGYHQIRMFEDDIAKTAFKNHEGHYEFLVMPFGLTNAPTTFQALMNEVFRPFLRKFTRAMVNSPVPTNLKQLRGFLGLTGYYRRFVKNYASISMPLTALLMKNAFGWNMEAQKAFEKLKNWYWCCATAESSSNCLPQQDLAPKHQVLSTYEKEFLAVIQALEKWRGYLLDRHFVIKTDHYSLKYLLDQRITTPAQMKWLLKLMGFDYEIVYKKGAKNVVADALSRVQGQTECLQLEVTTLSSELYDKKKMRNQIKQYIRQCDTCQRYKPELVPYPGLLQPLPIPTSVWAEISMDFIDGLPMSKGRTVIMVIVDRLSKYSHFISLTHPYTTIQVAQSFLDTIYRLHGLPKIIVSDKDAVFMNRFWKELFSLLQVQLHTSTAYHPQTDGQTEVVNRSLECYLRCMCGEKPKEWVNWIPLAKHWYNTSYHSTIKTTPYHVVYGQAPPDHITYTKGDSLVDVVDRSLSAREAAIDLLKFHIKRSQNRMKSLANKHTSDREFEKGVWVYLKLQPYRQATLRQGKQHKLSPKYFGPFLIMKKVGKVAYKLQLPSSSQIHHVFHVSQLKLYRGPIPKSSSQLPQISNDGLISEEPFAVLDRKMVKKGNTSNSMGQWDCCRCNLGDL